MKLSFFPQFKIVHTSDTFHGQLYCPVFNAVMCIGTILVASIYNNTTSLGNAYGTCVMFVTFFDTCMVSLVAIFVWRFSPYLVAFPFLVFAAMDGAYLSSALTKVPSGAWFTITLSGLLASVLLLWRFGKEQQWSAEAADRFPTSHFVKHHSNGTMSLADRFDGTSVSSFQGMGIFFDKAGETTPIVFSQFILKLTAAPEVSIFLHLRPLETPHVEPQDRHTISRLAIPNCYRLVVRHGYNDVIVTNDLAAVVYAQVRQHLLLEGPIKGSLSRESAEQGVLEPTGKDMTIETKQQDGDAEDSAIVDEDTTNEAVDVLDRAYNHKVLYIIGQEQMQIADSANFVRRFLLGIFLWTRSNTRGKMANLKVPKDSLIEVGFLKEI